MSRCDDERLADILASADAISAHLGRGSLDDGLVFDAVRVRLIEIGEAVKDISAELGVSLTYNPERKSVLVEASPTCRKVGVGGGT